VRILLVFVPGSAVPLTVLRMPSTKYLGAVASGVLIYFERVNFCVINTLFILKEHVSCHLNISSLLLYVYYCCDKPEIFRSHKAIFRGYNSPTKSHNKTSNPHLIDILVISSGKKNCLNFLHYNVRI
jgi:hypothetical protein